MEAIRVGLVGCGEVTQVIHLPTLDFLAEQFRPTAVCDVSPQVVDGVGERWRVPKRFVDYHDLVRQEDVDAVLVASPEAFHTEVTLAALAAGKHVLVEKPLCYTLREADAIIAAQRHAGRTVQVGYMRRYNPAFLAASRRVREMREAGGVRLVRVRDVIGVNALIVSQVARVIRPDDLPAGTLAVPVERKTAQIEEATGTAAREHTVAYGMLHGLASHDLSALREMLGRPRGVLYAALRQGGRYVTAALDYGAFICHVEIGLDRLPRFDAGMEVYGAEQVVRVTWDTPYVRNLPVRATITEAVGEPGEERGVATHDLHPAWADQYALEWQAFGEHIREGSAPKTSPADAREDIELILEIQAAMRDGGERVPARGG